MFNISSLGIITTNRGDSFEFPLVLKMGSSMAYDTYALNDTDVVYFAVMEPNQPFETAIIRKRFDYKDVDDNGNIKVRFWPEDTQLLLPGKYYYQAKLKSIDRETGREDVETIVEKTLFYIKE